ncbi:MAG TPA: hypothetical protein PKY50_20080, partial [Candidatus Competibacter sp.]|nr:hypothetical protein [Candidatus Competibacter sp.]
TVMALYGWLLAALPQPGTGINRFTAQVMTGGACALFAIGIPLAAAWFGFPSSASDDPNALDPARRELAGESPP